MSFGGGFGGFGQNNQQSGSTFGGGFGASNNNTNTGFGASNTGGGFGSNNNTTGGGLFGGGTQQNNSGGFGGSGFGANNNSNAFGAKTGFGSTTANTGGGMFGSSSNTANTGGGFGGFGSNTGTTGSAFGGGSTGGGVFGSNTQNKTGFGASTTGGSMFGNTGSTTTGGGFGSGGFGSNASAMGTGDPPGTGGTPFQAFSEKEGTSNTTNNFQNIVFQDPYKKWSPEELRLVDYAQGRKSGNPSGAGTFGQSSGFGAFGSSSNQQQQQTTGGFGSAANKPAGLFGGGSTTGGFGQSSTSTGFGANSNTTGSSLFGNNAAKPAGSGIFGGGASNTTTGNSLFGGGGGNTSGGFGQSSTSTGFGANSNTTGSSLFGNNSNQQKPAGTGFSFGNTGATNTTTSAFGTGNTNTTGGFGSTSNTGSSLFGGGNNQQQQSNTTNSLFGGGQQQSTASTGGFGSGFGQQNQASNAGGSAFGSNAQKPSLFGGGGTTTNTGSSLFGGGNNQQQQQNSGGLLGGGMNTQNQQKPSLFGGGLGGTQSNTGGTSLFGGGMNNNQNQQQSSGSLFGGGMNNQNQQKPSLFGSSTQASGTGFGMQNNQNQGSSLFGASNNQQQNQGMGNSLLGNSQQSNAPQGLTANLNDVSAYGSPSLFAGVGGSEVANPGPLATSLSGNSKPKRTAILPMYKLAPASASRYATPQKRGFGFSYGTPGGSPASSISSTPGGLGRSLLGSSSSGNLSKSMSTNNLRRTYNSEDSILNPGAFSSSSGSRWYGSTGSKKLVINRDIRSDLFSTPNKDKSGADGTPGSRKLSKRVSFDTPNAESEDGTPARPALPAPEDTPASPEATPRQNRTSNSETPATNTPEADQAQGKELAIVPEEDNNPTPEGSRVSSGLDNAPGEYWMSPSLAELQNMNRMQRQKIDGLTVGRENVGSISFKVPVDISAIDLDEICDGIIILEPRSATVYPVLARKPPQGKGLNVPARIVLEQSWPRGGKRQANDPKRIKKHMDRLKSIPDTEFESYDKDTGVWAFSVEHFTTYGLDDSDDDSDIEVMEQEVGIDMVESPSAPPAFNDSFGSAMEDDTFDFKTQNAPPGAFDPQEQLFQGNAIAKQSFLGVSSADSAPQDVRLSLEKDAIEHEGEEYAMSEDEDQARSSFGHHQAAELDDISSDDGVPDTRRGTPGGVLRARMRAMKDSAHPMRVEVADGDDWAEMLRKTVSPVKRDRQGLREFNDAPTRQPAFVEDTHASDDESDFRKTSIWRKDLTKSTRIDRPAANTRQNAQQTPGFATSIDLMNSLFEKAKPQSQSMRASSASKGFPKLPYNRQGKDIATSASEQAYHDASRPTWGPNETLVLTTKPSQRFTQTSRNGSDGVLSFQRPRIETESQAIRLANFSTKSSRKYLKAQADSTKVSIKDGVPLASLDVPDMRHLFHSEDATDPASSQEKKVWDLASILFNDGEETDSQARKAALSKYWADLVKHASSTNIGLAGSEEEKAVACLAGHRVVEACKHLVEGRNFRLSTLVALIGTSDSTKQDMQEQIDSWMDLRMLSEFPEPIRVIYELLSGNVCVCQGLKGVPVEDRMETFVISEKFGLDWKQAFGLRLWYAIKRDDDLSAAVTQFKSDLDQAREAKPRPWYAEQGIPTLWEDTDPESRQDLLWGLLQLYADENTDLEAVLRPENSQVSPLDMRLTWQLGIALVASGKVSYGANGAEKADATALAYASQLTGAGEWLEAVFVLLHLSDADARAKAIREHLCRHAAMIGSPEGESFATLTHKWQIPAAWVWEALALYNRSVKNDTTGEVECLLRAGSLTEAHRVLSQEVAPRAVVEREYEMLSSLISQFQEKTDAIPDWSSGGEIYSFFLEMMYHQRRGEATPTALLDRLMAGLRSMNEDTPDTDLMRYAAISDMADEAAREILKSTKKKQAADLRSKILNLPLTEDRRLAYSADLSVPHKREVMSH